MKASSTRSKDSKLGRKSRINRVAFAAAVVLAVLSAGGYMGFLSAGDASKVNATERPPAAAGDRGELDPALDKLDGVTHHG